MSDKLSAEIQELAAKEAAAASEKFRRHVENGYMFYFKGLPVDYPELIKERERLVDSVNEDKRFKVSVPPLRWVI